VLRILSPLKIHRPRRGLNPRFLCPMASTQTVGHRGRPMEQLNRHFHAADVPNKTAICIFSRMYPVSSIIYLYKKYVG
jgi:hypothetical protein